MPNNKARVPRVSKSPEERIRDCETHLAFLKEARDNYPTDRERYKQVAAKLRVLVCKFRNNKPLLLDLMDEYGFNYEVRPAAPPAGPPLKGPIPLVGWRDDPAQQALAKELEQALAAKLLTRDEARRIAANIAKLPELLHAYGLPKVLLPLARKAAHQRRGAADCGEI